uniref:Uncharacterized protein n=1 Tax=Anguilla anguilla TaxID=7936 RepID=A0A0E9WP31_ANGAN
MATNCIGQSSVFILDVESRYYISCRTQRHMEHAVMKERQKWRMLVVF